MCQNYPICSADGVACPLNIPFIDTDQYPFEAHITVQGSDIQKFREDCATIGVKPIVLDLQNASGTVVMKDVMTSSVYKGTLNNAKMYLNVLRLNFEHLGHKVIRLKLETVPWHPLTKELTDTQYFESHLAVICSDERQEELGVLAKSLDCHRSRNVFKKKNDGKSIMMVTHRNRTNTDSFKASVSNIVQILREHGFEVEKEIVEFAIYDTRVDHDSDWLAA